MGPGKKNTKATKKFERTHLKGVLDKRKADAKVKQRAQVKAKKQSKRSRDDDFFKGPQAEGADGAPVKPKKNAHDATVSGMSVDDFFSGGFEIIDKKANGKKAKANANGAAGKLGKRKRDAPEDDQDNSNNNDDDDDDDDDDSNSNSDADSEDADVGMSKGAMDALAKNDPEFYKYLQENDPEALDFDEDVDMAEIDELSASEDDQQPKKKRKKAAVEAESDDDDDEFASHNELTKPMVARWKKSITETKSLRAARQVVLAFRSAAHLNEDDEDKKQKYSISDPEVFHDILIVALKQIPEVLQHHCPIKESASGKVTIPTESKKFKTLSILIKSYAASVLHLLGTLSDDATLKLTLSALTPLLPYLLSFRKVLKNLIKTVVHFWSQSSSSEATRITAFLVLRRLVVIGDKGVREAVLKVTYQGLIQGSRSTNPNTLQGINLMKNSAAELWGIDQSIGYTTAFTFIRQLAIHLRNSITHNQNDSYKAVYNWQYVHSLDFWSCVLAEHCSLLKEAEATKESQLKLLIYPLVQVTLGAMRLIPTALYFPLRFQLIRSLLRLSRATGTYIPLASALLEVLNSAEMKKPPKATTLKALDYAVQYKAPKSYLRTRIYQDGVGEQVVELFCEYFGIWSTNIAFPEFALPVVIMLKRWLKEARGNKKATKGAGNRNTKLVTQIALLVQKLEANAKFIEDKRSKVDFAPKNRDQVDKFLSGFDWEKTPIGVYVVSQRKLKAEKARMMEEARKEDDKKRKEDEKRRIEHSDPVDSDSGDDDEDEDEDEGSDGEIEEEEDEDEGSDEEEDEDEDEEEED
ncbi:Noc2p family-domain-containing protein [Coniella lustricola]|uniref:Noc2p family-domain-containing protein n=1 Tax=Coniella lustricola TaxID=2025994 RepID=A0A2T3A3C0_9PEZI|nr:Noc2p family-domain-containing protein [Coniella lustricola]